MIKKDYFPTQEVPIWVKEKVMQKIKIGSKKLRLLYMIRYKFFVPVVALLLIMIGGYLSLNTGNKTIITGTTLSGNQNEIYIQNTNDTDDLLQKKLAEAEIILNDISDYANKEEDITL